MRNFSGMAFFCEDLRQDTNGGYILTGVSTDNIFLGEIPSNIPKLCIYARVNVMLAASYESVEINLLLPHAKPSTMALFTEDFVERTANEAASNELPYAGFLAGAILSPFPVAEPCQIKIEAVYGKSSEIIGCLNIKMAPTPPLT